MEKTFALIELMINITIIVIVAAIVIPILIDQKNHNESLKNQPLEKEIK